MSSALNADSIRRINEDLRRLQQRVAQLEAEQKKREHQNLFRVPTPKIRERDLPHKEEN